MPEVKLYVFSLALPDAEKGMEYVSKIQEIVAANLNCRDDDGNILPALDPDRVIVYLTSFGGPDGLLLATDLVAVGEIIGFDYEDRMRNISDRLSAIKGRIQQLLQDYSPAGGQVEDHDVSLRFTPTRQDCWI